MEKKRKESKRLKYQEGQTFTSEAGALLAAGGKGTRGLGPPRLTRLEHGNKNGRELDVGRRVEVIIEKKLRRNWPEESPHVGVCRVVRAAVGGP